VAGQVLWLPGQTENSLARALEAGLGAPANRRLRLLAVLYLRHLFLFGCWLLAVLYLRHLFLFGCWLLAVAVLRHLLLFGCCLLAVAVLLLPADLKQQQLLQSHS